MGMYVIERQGFDNIEDGKYTVNGIAEIITKKEDGTPFFKEMNGELKVMIKLRTTTDAEGPAMSLTPAEFVGLVHAFGAVGFMPSYEDRMLGATLIRGMNEANEKAKRFSVMSEGGYANRVYEIHPEEGKYTVKFAYASAWIDGKFGRFKVLRFEILGDGNGKPCVWNGYQIPIFLSDVFVDMQEDNGKVLNAMELEQPIMMGGQNARRWTTFIKYCAPEVENRHWEISPERSEYGICEVTEPTVVIAGEALKAERKLKVYYKHHTNKNGGAWKFEILNLPEWNDLEAIQTQKSVDAQDFVKFVNEHNWPVADDPEELFTDIFESVKPVIFSDTGKQWAAKYLGGEAGPWAEAGLPLENKPPMEALTSTQLETLLAKMNQRFS